MTADITSIMLLVIADLTWSSVRSVFKKKGREVYSLLLEDG